MSSGRKIFPPGIVVSLGRDPCVMTHVRCCGEDRAASFRKLPVSCLSALSELEPLFTRCTVGPMVAVRISRDAADGHDLLLLVVQLAASRCRAFLYVFCLQVSWSCLLVFLCFRSNLGLLQGRSPILLVYSLFSSMDQCHWVVLLRLMQVFLLLLIWGWWTQCTYCWWWFWSGSSSRHEDGGCSSGARFGLVGGLRAERRSMMDRCLFISYTRAISFNLLFQTLLFFLLLFLWTLDYYFLVS